MIAASATPLAVGDEQVAREKPALGSVERSQGLALVRAPHDDAAAGELRPVEAWTGFPTRA